jgi:alcohol dehydrogenase YqhD (iron-dependent ADH family)
LIAIPTVAGSGSESNCGAVITNWMVHEKRVLSHESLYPVVSIVDPELTLSLPVKPTLQGGVDIFCHLLEPYLTDTSESSLTDVIREATMKMVVRQLPFARADLKNLNIRIDLSWASTVACSAFASIGGGGGGMSLHGIEHAISAYCDAAHGDGLAALLPAWLEYTQQGGEERYNTLGRNLFLGKDAVLSINEWLCKIGMRLRLRDLGIERGILPKIAASVEQTASWVKDHPRGMQFQDILNIYEASY